MKDRIPVNPGRVLITPEDGSAAFYATMTRADNPTEEGTKLNKANLLKDATAAMFGFGDAAVPDEVLAFLGKYAQHWWRRRTVTFSEKLGDGELFYLSYSPDSSGKSTMHTIYYSDSITIDDSGNVSLAEPILSVEANYDSYSTALAAVRGKYVKNNANPKKSPETIYKIDSAATTSYENSSAYYRYIPSGYSLIVSSQVNQAGDWENYQSNDRNAYPDSGFSDFYENYYLGVPLDNAISANPIEIGNYTGTGSSSSSVSLNFVRAPKYGVLIFGAQNRANIAFTILTVGYTTAGVSQNGTSGYDLTVTWGTGNLSVTFDAGTTNYPERYLNVKNGVYTYLVL